MNNSSTPIDLFFFQAEDGIRDDLVTGVQTCALPISLPTCDCALVFSSDCRAATRTSRPSRAPSTCWSSRSPTRSEERRVGKECSSRLLLDHFIEKNILN